MQPIKVELSSDRPQANVSVAGKTVELTAQEMDRLIRDLAAVRARMTPVHPAVVPDDAERVHRSDNLLWSVRAAPDRAAIQFATHHPGLGWTTMDLSREQVEDLMTSFEFELVKIPERPMTRLTAALLLIALAVPARAQSVEDFYRGRTITILVGFTSGGGYDLYARMLARHMGRHVPGNPAIVVQNMPGAGSLKATQYIDGVAPKDGTMLATVSRGMVTDPLLADARFDATRLTWVGSITSETSVCATWKTSPVKTWDDMFRRDFTLGGSNIGADPDNFALVLRNVFGARVRLVTGYPGGNDINLAMERGEVDGRCGWSWTSLKTQKQWLPQVTLLAQFGLNKDPDLAGVPAALDKAANDEQRQVLRLVVAGQFVGRPYFAPPGIPDDRKMALRQAFDATMKDPEFLAEAAKLDLEISPVTAAAIDAFLAEVYRTPKDVIAKAVAAIRK